MTAATSDHALHIHELRPDLTPVKRVFVRASIVPGQDADRLVGELIDDLLRCPDWLWFIAHVVRSQLKLWISASPRSGDRPKASIRSSFFSSLTCRSPISSYVSAARSWRINGQNARGGIENGGCRDVMGNRSSV